MLRIRPSFSRSVPCDLCGGQDVELLADRDRRGNQLATVICRHCGLVAHACIPSDAELAEYYQRQYRLQYHGEYVPSPHRVIREWNRGRQLLKMLLPYVRPADRIIEIGCGIGCTVKQFESAGLDIQGVEPGDGFRSFAEKSLHARVGPGVLASIPSGADYTFAMLVHVLEHLRSPTDSLTRIRSLLADDGRLYVEVPNAGAPHAAPGKMFHLAHIYNFTQDTLGMLANKCRFRVARWLSSPTDKNLRVVLECSDSSDWRLERDSYQRSLRSIAGLSTLRYHFRWSYLRARFRSLLGHLSDHIMAHWRLKRILAACQ